MPKLTVIIPALNAMPYLPKALASLCAQTFRNFEVILWDNGSTDGTAEEAMRWIPALLPGRVVTDKPLPLHHCLHQMVQEACTPFIARMDADDISKPRRFEVQINSLMSDPALAVVGSQFEEIDSQGALLSRAAVFPTSYSDILASFLTCNAILHPSVMMRRQPIIDAGNYLPCPQPCEDYDLWMRVAKEHRVANLPDNLLFYRVHSSGIISSARASGQLEDPNRRCIQRHCSELFGITPSLYHRLRRRSLWPSCLILVKAAARIAQRSNVSLLHVLRSHSFLFSARCLTANSDIVSRAFWSLSERFLPG